MYLLAVGRAQSIDQPCHDSSRGCVGSTTVRSVPGNPGSNQHRPGPLTQTGVAVAPGHPEGFLPAIVFTCCLSGIAVAEG